ncbi:unnamed protein product [Chrysodeixis includens]|uniref:Uncharacterized protein n=1 Tax=Chrysodeixis includens TaxID=689277 RepID=A0A9N8KZY3_CHRIL|nr:unnamed protein product [Chrysodeixis includens]
MALYKDLLNTIRQIEIPMKLTILLSMALVFPKVLIMVYKILLGDSYQFQRAFIIGVCSVLTLPFIPALLAGAVNSETEKITLVFIKQLIVCRDRNTRKVIKDTLTFLQHRTFRCTIWRLCEVDVQTIAIAFKSLVTFTVAMVQFAHFCD